MTFGEKIKQARKKQGYTQRQLAEKIGAKHNSVSDWENNKNKPDPDTIELLCGVLGIEPNHLLGSQVELPSEVSIDELRCNTKDEVHLVLDYRKLSKYNKVKASKYVHTLAESTQMEQALNAASIDATATDEDRRISDNIMYDDAEWT